MNTMVDFEEILRDSMEEVEGEMCELKSEVDTMMNLCTDMINAGKTYNTASQQFINKICELAQQSTKYQVRYSLTEFAENLKNMTNSHTILFDQIQRSIKTQLHTEEREAELIVKAQAPRNKQRDVEEAMNILTATRNCFRDISFSYVLQINGLLSRRRSDIQKSMLSFMYAQLNFFSQCNEKLSEPQPLKVGGDLDEQAVDKAKEKQEVEQEQSTIQQKDFSSETKLEENVGTENSITMEGYLFKQSNNAFKTWNRRWFSIQNNQLVYHKKKKDIPTVLVEDLRLCTVKLCENTKRRFCFEVVMPMKRCMLQADSEELREAWIRAIQNGIITAFGDKGEGSGKQDQKSSTSTGSLDSEGDTKKPSLKEETALQKVLAVSGNSCCCDCGQPDPHWASINLGITLCIQCSGIHRSLGVHVSKVRSLTLDKWEPELLQMMCELGNNVINEIYEAQREELGARKPNPGDPRPEVEAYIKAKYVDRQFVRQLTDDELQSKVISLSKQNEPKEYSSGLQLIWASYACSLPDMAQALAHRGQVNWVNTEDEKKTPLIMAVHGGSLVTCELLLQNGANVNQPDAQGRGPLHYATMLGHTGQVCLLLKREANRNAADIDGQTPLSIAENNSDIITLLTMAKDEKHSTIQQKDFSNDTKLEADNRIVMEGYLFKQSNNAFKTWNRRWFSIQNNQLLYHENKKKKDNPTVVVEDLRLCTVKPCEDSKRRFYFEVVTPMKSCRLQADCEEMRLEWINAIQNGIVTAFGDKAGDF